MTSIRRHLTLRLVIATLAIAGASVALIYVYLRIELLEQFDNALKSRARTLASLVRVDEDHRDAPHGGLELELTERAMKEYRAGRHPDYFQVWDESGKVLARSDSMKGHDLSRATADADTGDEDNAGRFFYLTLPDGSQGRAIEYVFEPGFEDDRYGHGHRGAGAQLTKRPITPVPLVLATNLAEMHESLGHIFGALLVVMLAMAVGSVLTVVAVVRRGLRPLDDIGDDMSRIDPATLATRFDANSLPGELRPIAEKLNELLARLDAAFRRERRFTSNVAHELRTPIAELRSLSEVAINWPGDTEAASRNFKDALGIARQMESVVTALLGIARCAAGQQPLAMSTMQIADVVAEAWRPHSNAAYAREIQVDVSEIAPATIDSDRTVLSAILSNLLANAVTYTPIGGAMGCRGRVAGDRYLLEIFNDNNSLAAKDLPFIFEPFWRKDSARTDSSNSGLGLALVATYSELLGVKLRATLPSPELFVVGLEIPLAPTFEAPACKSATIPAEPAIVNETVAAH